MSPSRFPETNYLLKGMPELDVDDLHTHNDGEQIISLWSMTWRERISALLFGKVWCFVQAAKTHPPIALSACRGVFEDEHQDSDQELPWWHPHRVRWELRHF